MGRGRLFADRKLAGSQGSFQDGGVSESRAGGIAMMTAQPDAGGHFGPYGGRFVPEVLMAPLEELEKAYLEARSDPAFQAELGDLLRNYAGRPTPLYFARRLTEHLGGARIYIKREDLLHTGAHKINNTLGQGLLAQRMGKRRIIAETGAGQHGVATATVCARLGLDCVVYMGEEDMRRQRLNVFRMRLLGAQVHAQKTPLKGQRFETIEAAQAYLDHWEERWADTRIHGTTKRQVAAMFAEEKPALLPLPVEPFRYYQYGERTVNLDGCVEVDAAYYGAPPGWIGRVL